MTIHCQCFRLSLFSDINVSQGSVATFVLFDGIFNDDLYCKFTNECGKKEFGKSVSIWLSYKKVWCLVFL